MQSGQSGQSDEGMKAKARALIAAGDPDFIDALVNASPLGRAPLAQTTPSGVQKENIGLGGWFEASPESKAKLSEKIQQGDPAFIDALLSAAPLHAAARRGDEALAKALVECGALLEAKQGGLTPSEQAMSHGHSALSKWLIDARGSKMGVGADEKMAVASIGTPDFSEKLGTRRPERWTPRDEAFWRGDAAEFKTLNRQMSERRFERGEKASELDAACDMGDFGSIKERLTQKRERLGMPSDAPAASIKKSM